MSVIHALEYKQSKKRAQELKTFLLKLDSISDILYDNLKYDGVFEVINKLEDVRIKYYVEFYEHNNIVQMKGKK